MGWRDLGKRRSTRRRREPTVRCRMGSTVRRPNYQGDYKARACQVRTDADADGSTLCIRCREPPRDGDRGPLATTSPATRCRGRCTNSRSGTMPRPPRHVRGDRYVALPRAC
jgi:hypothetical protein